MSEQPIDLAAERKRRAHSTLVACVATDAKELGLDLEPLSTLGVVVDGARVSIALRTAVTPDEARDLACAILNAADLAESVELPNVGLGYDPLDSYMLDELREHIADQLGGVAEKGFYFDRVKEVATELRAVNRAR